MNLLNLVRRKSSSRSWLGRLASPRTQKPTRGGRPRRPLGLEALEDRVVPAQYVDLGGLRFYGDFTQVGDDYSATGAVQLGLASAMKDALTPLVDIATNAGGSVAFTKGTPDPTFTVTNAAVTATQGTPGLSLWQTTGAAVFDVASLIGGGVALTPGGQPFAVAGGLFTLDNLAFFNPGGGDTADAQVRLQGGLTVAPLTGLTLVVGGTDFVTIDHTGVILTGVSGPVNGSLTLGGLGFDTAALQAAYDRGRGQFVLSGASSFQLEGNAVNVTFANPGLVVADGVAQQLGLTLTSDLTIGGLPFTTDNLTVTYDDLTQIYTVTGNSSVIIGGRRLAVVLGGGNTQGLIITNGALTKLEMTGQGILLLQDLEVQAGDPVTPLTIAYTQGSGEYTLTGPIVITTLFDTAATLGANGQDVLKVHDGSFVFEDFNLQLSNVNLGAFTITTFMLSFTPDSFSATLDLTFPNNWVVGGTVGFLNGNLNTIGLELQAGTGGIPIAETGITITGFSGEVQNFQNPSDLIVSGSLTAAWGTEDVITMTGGFLVSKDELVLDANVSFLKTLGSATGTLTLDWGQDNYELEVDAVWLDGLLTFDAVIDLSDGDDLYVKALADLNVPQAIPFIGGDHLASLDFVLEYHGGQPLSDSFVAAWVNFAVFEIGVKVDFTPKVSVIGSSTIKQIDSGPPTQPTSQVYYYDIPYTVPSDATQANLQVTWPDVGGNQSVAIVIPNGPTIDQGQFSAANGYSLVPQFTSRQAIMVGVVNPAGPYVALTPGNYTLRLISNLQFGAAPRLTASFGYARPTIAVGELPAFPGGATVTVPLSGQVVTALGPNARATLFFDSASAGYQGTPILGASNLPVTVDGQGNWTVSGTWNVDGLLPLPYYVYAAINDGVNGTVYSAYSRAVTPTPALSGTVSNPMNNDAALSGLLVYVDVNPNGTYDPGTDPSTTTGPTGFYAFAASQLPTPGTPFFVGVVIPAGFRLHPGTINPVETTYDGNPLAVNFQLDEFTAIHGTVYSDLVVGRVGQSGWTVYLDANGNGVRDAGEVSTLSAANGLYAFRNVPRNSTQTVRVQLREGYYQTAPAAPGTWTVHVGDEPFRIYDNNNFGVLPFSTISGTVTGHLLNHGVLEPNTTPLQDWTVQLLQDGSVVATTTTDSHGNYSFGGLRTGTYAVEEVVPSGWRQIEPFTGKLLLGDPVGSHTWQLPDDQFAVDVVVADFDGNGKLDTAVLGYTSNASNVWVYYNGDFTNPVGLNPDTTFSENLPLKILAASVFGGRGPDLVVLWELGLVTVLPNQGGALQNGSPNWYLPTNGPQSLVKGTFFQSVNGGDQLAASYVDLSKDVHGIVTFYDKGTPFVATRTPGVNPTNLAAGDINGDGITDLFLGSGGGSPVVYYGNGKGGFNPTTITSLPAAAATQIPGVVVVGDINGDGLLDLGIFDQNSFFHYALQDASGGFTQSFSPGVGVSGAAVDAATLQDVNGDFRPDLVWTVLDDSGSNPLVVALNTGTPNGWFATAQQTRWPLNTTVLLFDTVYFPFATGDFDGDGLNDLVVLNFVGADLTGLVQLVVNESTIATGPIPLHIQGGQSPSGIDFVSAQLGQVNGRVFDDLTRDGRYLVSKPGRAGVTVYVDLNANGQIDEGEPTAVTGTQGAYAFAGLPAGTYQVRWLDDPGRRATTPDGGVYKVDLSDPDRTVTGLDFGNAVSIDHVLAIPADAGTGDWTVLVNRGRLEVLDRDLGVVGSQPLADLHSLTVQGADGRPNRLTFDLTAGGFFTLPGGVRFVGGTSRDDALRVLLGSAGDVVTVEGATANVNNRLSASWANLDRLTIHTGAGNDTVIVTGTPLARGGVTTLNGGDGNDVLLAGAGRNLLIGGEGSDSLLGGGRSRRGGSILIGGSTAHDADPQALDALLAEWSSRRSLPTRIANLTDGSGSRRRLNDDFFLDADTLIDDGVTDVLFGDSRVDWFLPFPGDRVIDRNPRR